MLKLRKLAKENMKPHHYSHALFYFWPKIKYGNNGGASFSPHINNGQAKQ